MSAPYARTRARPNRGKVPICPHVPMAPSMGTWGLMGTLPYPLHAREEVNDG